MLGVPYANDVFVGVVVRGLDRVVIVNSTGFGVFFPLPGIGTDRRASQGRSERSVGAIIKMEFCSRLFDVVEMITRRG